jgi:hypothetical protein
MAYNVSGWGTAEPNATVWVGYLLNGGQDFGAQFAEAKHSGTVCLLTSAYWVCRAAAVVLTYGLTAVSVRSADRTLAATTIWKCNGFRPRFAC